VSALSSIYGRLARLRRARYERHPERRRRLARPVISVGNLVAGGSGKTPIVLSLTALLAREGQRPSVLSRGYGRRQRDGGVVVVSDGTRLLADVDRAGDEPLMLARALTAAGATNGHGSGLAGVFVAGDRFLAGQVAEQRYGATVHVLDDGFQHLGLARDVDLVVVSARDLEGEQLLPSGRLREPVETIRRADALLVTGGGTLVEARALAARWGVAKAFTVTRTPAVPRMLEPYGTAPRVPRSAPVVAVAGIARPQRFLDDLVANGWTVADALIFRDHHRFDRGDLARVARRLRETGAALVLTTEKDVMRLLPWRPLPFPLAWVPLAIGIEPADDFRLWLRWRLGAGHQGEAMNTAGKGH
jgi:tetraacyldisaccharide 4'-kinase